MSEAYFERLGDKTFRATEHTSGAWRESEQHIGPSLGLLAHAIETDRDRRRDDRLVVGRLSYDIWGTVAVGELDVQTQIVRPGRTIELVEATLSHGERTIVTVRAWLMKTGDTTALSGSTFAPIASRDAMQPWNPSDVWPGGFLASAECFREEREPGRAVYWLRPRVALIDGESVSPIARSCGLIDIANGMAVRENPRSVAFPNIDVTVHFFAEPKGDWLGFDTSVSFGSGGVGLTSSTLHDESGPVGTVAQILTVRPNGDAQ